MSHLQRHYLDDDASFRYNFGPRLGKGAFGEVHSISISDRQSVPLGGLASGELGWLDEGVCLETALCGEGRACAEASEKLETIRNSSFSGSESGMLTPARSGEREIYFGSILQHRSHIARPFNFKMAWRRRFLESFEELHSVEGKRQVELRPLLVRVCVCGPRSFGWSLRTRVSR